MVKVYDEQLIMQEIEVGGPSEMVRLVQVL